MTVQDVQQNQKSNTKLAYKASKVIMKWSRSIAVCRSSIHTTPVNTAIRIIHSLTQPNAPSA